MAVAFDAKSFGVATSGTTITISHIVGGANRALLVFAGNQDNIAASGVTYSGVALTAIANASTRASLLGKWWYLIAPAVGTANIVVTFASAVSQAGAAGLSFTGVKQSGIPEAEADSNGFPSSTATQTTNITTITNNALVVGAQMADHDWGATAPAGSLNNRYDQIVPASGGRYQLAIGDMVQVAAGAITPGFTVIGFESYVQQFLSLEADVPASNAAGVTRMMEIF